VASQIKRKKNKDGTWTASCPLCNYSHTPRLRKVYTYGPESNAVAVISAHMISKHGTKLSDAK
jgi:hypothetical protein